MTPFGAGAVSGDANMNGSSPLLSSHGENIGCFAPNAARNCGGVISMTNKQLAKLIFHGVALVVSCTLLAAALVTWFGL